jgi:hypothetical protein
LKTFSVPASAHVDVIFGKFEFFFENFWKKIKFFFEFFLKIFSFILKIFEKKFEFYFEIFWKKYLVLFWKFSKKFWNFLENFFCPHIYSCRWHIWKFWKKFGNFQKKMKRKIKMMSYLDSSHFSDNNGYIICRFLIYRIKDMNYVILNE